MQASSQCGSGASSRSVSPAKARPPACGAATAAAAAADALAAVSLASGSVSGGTQGSGAAAQGQQQEAQPVLRQQEVEDDDNEPAAAGCCSAGECPAAAAAGSTEGLQSEEEEEEGPEPEVKLVWDSSSRRPCAGGAPAVPAAVLSPGAAAAAELKEKGNSMLKAGDCAAAVKCYTSALAKLRASGQQGGSSAAQAAAAAVGAGEGGAAADAPPAEAQLAATLHSNRAHALMRLLRAEEVRVMQRWSCMAVGLSARVHVLRKRVSVACPLAHWCSTAQQCCLQSALANLTSCLQAAADALRAHKLLPSWPKPLYRWVGAAAILFMETCTNTQTGRDTGHHARCSGHAGMPTMPLRPPARHVHAVVQAGPGAGGAGALGGGSGLLQEGKWGVGRGRHCVAWGGATAALLAPAIPACNKLPPCTVCNTAPLLLAFALSILHRATRCPLRAARGAASSRRCWMRWLWRRRAPAAWRDTMARSWR